MSERIEVGDLVMIVGPRRCCPEKGTFGFVFTVTKIVAPRNGKWSCFHCHKKYVGDSIASYDDKSGVELRRLKKINPPAIDESTETREELAA
jgi:hypothetical protein